MEITLESTPPRGPVWPKIVAKLHEFDQRLKREVVCAPLRLYGPVFEKENV